MATTTDLDGTVAAGKSVPRLTACADQELHTFTQVVIETDPDALR